MSRLRDRISEWVRLAPTGVLGVAWVVAPTIGGAALIWYLGTAADWLRSWPVGGWLIYVVFFAAMSGLGILPTTAQSVVGAWVFGFAAGYGGALVGVAGGAALGYAIARAVSAERVERFIDRFPKARVLRGALLARGSPKTLIVVAVFRMPPHFPFALSNLLLSATGVPFRSFLPGSVLGMAPRLGVIAFASAAAAASGARDLQEFITRGPGLWVAVSGFVALAVALLLLGELGRRALAATTK